MCGLAGIITSGMPENLNENLLRMIRSMSHRGPDGEGIWSSSNQQVNLSHCRLSIMDLSERGNQPMLSDDSVFTVVFNGEIYNHLEIRQECEIRGSRFRTTTDTEVILEAYRHWGTECVKRFNGMWAFVLYDAYRNQLFLSRDRFAIKPLYYGVFQNKLYFSSELSGLLAAHDAFREIDDITVRLFLDHGYLDRHEWTFYKLIKRFPHAHNALINLNTFNFSGERLVFDRYWAPPEKNLKIKYEDAVQELRNLLFKSVSLHLRSDVPVGACLSGGIDSTALVCIGSQASSSPWLTFSTRYPHFKDIDESHWAETANVWSGSLANYVEPRYESFVNNFDKILEIQGEPYGSTSIFAQYSIYQAMGQSPIKVSLGGQGADELFSGYVGLLPFFLENLLLNGNLLNYRREAMLLQKNYQLISNKIQYIKGNWKSLLRRRYQIPRSFLALSDWNSVVEDHYETRFNKLNLKEISFENRLTELLIETNIPQLLRYEDRNSMAFSIESRVPYLEKELIEFSLALPATFKIRNGLTKSILRDALLGLIPESIRNRLDKQGFPTPEKLFLKNAFNINVMTNGSLEWRTLITDKWIKLQKCQL